MKLHLNQQVIGVAQGYNSSSLLFSAFPSIFPNSTIGEHVTVKAGIFLCIDGPAIYKIYLRLSRDWPIFIYIYILRMPAE